MTRYQVPKEHFDHSALSPELRSLNPICLDLLAARGFRDEQSIRDLLFPSLDTAIAPFRCTGIGEVLRELETAVKNDETVVVYRDYDVDGISAGAIALGALSKLGVDVHQYANQRDEDGYGMCQNGVDRILNQWPATSIILTVDNGVTAHDAINYARGRGLKVLVTDHHMPKDTLPVCDGLVDLKREDEVYPFREFCGCGVIFRIMLDLYRRLGKDPSPVLEMIDIVALATVADVVPLLGENRALLKEGLRLINNGCRPFFRIMNRLFNTKEVTSETLAFYYAPAINSLSRMNEDTNFAVEAMLSTYESWIELQVTGFITVNNARKKLCDDLYKLALSKISAGYSDSAIVLYDEAFTYGVVGIIAGRLKEKFNLPVVVLAKTDRVLRGSARSIDQLNIIEALSANPYLETSGGHSRAAGLSLKPEDLDDFIKSFKRYCKEHLDGVDTTPVVPLAAVLKDDDLTEGLVHDLKMLEPFGEGFPEPIFGFRTHVDSVRYMGDQSQHAKFLTSGGKSVIAWNKGEKARNLPALPSTFVGVPKLNVWKETTSVQFISRSDV